MVERSVRDREQLLQHDSGWWSVEVRFGEWQGESERQMATRTQCTCAHAYTHTHARMFSSLCVACDAPLETHAHRTPFPSSQSGSMTACTMRTTTPALGWAWWPSSSGCLRSCRRCVLCCVRMCMMKVCVRASHKTRLRTCQSRAPTISL